jgi:single-stranded-DNA-specific exonuclease
MGAAPATFTLPPYDYAAALALERELGLAEPVAVTLVRRGYRTVAEARTFLEAAESHDPFEFAGMDAIVERLRAAAAARLLITVHGDYDVDGTMATAIMVRALRELGTDCDWYIPSRAEDGYGLTAASIERLRERGTGLILTVDCGIACAEEVATATAAGMEVIVTDHHQPPDALPGCPIVHPAISGYPCPELCATGVAYKLAAALHGPDWGDRDLDLVALATVADLVPLRGENRALVRRGLELARRGQRAGMRALCAAAGVSAARLDEGDLAFHLAPRINAAGRLYRADAAVELMLTSDDARAEAIAADLDRANRERRAVEAEVLAEAERARAALPSDLAAAPALVLAGEGWHPGVVGIVASRLAEEHLVPTVLVALGPDGRGRGSGRSIPGFDLLAALRACGDHLLAYGGHRAAAGLEIKAASVDAFRRAFATHATTVLGPEARQAPEQIDAVVGCESLGLEVAEQVRRLGPFGVGNPEVRLLVPSARLADVRPMGTGERHARFTLATGSRRALGVAFGVNGELAEAARDGALDVSVGLEVNQWNGAIEPRVVLGRVHRPAPAPAAAGEPARPDEGEWWDRVESELQVALERWPVEEPEESRSTREVVDRRGRSGVAAVAALAAAGEPVLVIACDALRRRELVERAAVPARFGGGAVALVSARFADDATRTAVGEAIAKAGVVLADWSALARDLSLPERFPHVIAIDPPPTAALDRALASGRGYLHLAWSEAHLDLACRAHEAEWPSRAVLAAVYRALRERGESGGEVAAGEARAALSGPVPYERAPEAAARCLRALTETGAVSLHQGPHRPLLRVVSSAKNELEASAAFAAFRARSQEGVRYLTERTRS